jgi:transketolase
MELAAKSCELRIRILNLVYNGKAGHIGGDFSVCDILNVLYSRIMNVTPENFHEKDHDRFILSKGHSVEALYSILCDRGFITEEDLKTYSQFGSKFIGHPNNKVPGIEMNSGSLGHGLSLGVGMALSGKRCNGNYRVYVVMGDGELAEGSVWEGAMAAGHYKLDNLCAVVDRNKLQISGPTKDVMSQYDLEGMWKSLGWNVINVNGNDTEQLVDAFVKAEMCSGRPSVLIADTVKGCGVSFMENKAEWHHKVPTQEEYDKALAELEKRLKEESL